jgi:hypothetical protein
VCLIGGGLITTGCSLLRHEASATKSDLQSISGVGGKAGATITVVTLQGDVMREAD